METRSHAKDSVEIPIRFLKILQCLHCKDGHLTTIESGELVCGECSHSYSFQNGIPDLRPPLSMPLPKVYGDPDYKAWIDFQVQSKDYIYGKGLMAYIQNAGHRAVRMLGRGKDYPTTLDLGCGTGVHYPYLDSPEGCFGLDMDQNSLEDLKSRFPGFFAARADACHLPIKDQCVDRIIDIYNLEHLIYLDHALEEMSRILTPGGDVFISVPNEAGFLWTLGRNVSTARKFTTDALNYKRACEIDHINCIWQLERAFKRHFQIKKRQFFPFFFPSFHFNLVTTYHCVKM